MSVTPLDRGGSGGEVAAVELADPLPAVDRGVHAVAGALRGEERVPGAVVGVELVLLAEAGEDAVELRDLVRRRVLVVVAEQAEERAAQARQQRLEALERQREALRRLAEHVGAVAVDGGV